MSGDLRAVLSDSLYTDGSRGILAALAAADEPLVATVECPCPSAGRSNEACAHFNHGTVRIVAMTEDVLRARLRANVVVRMENATATQRFRFLPSEVDAIVRALFGEAGDE